MPRWHTTRAGEAVSPAREALTIPTRADRSPRPTPPARETPKATKQAREGAPPTLESVRPERWGGLIVVEVFVVLVVPEQIFVFFVLEIVEVEVLFLFFLQIFFF